jgi:alkylation response protein AidB-like acyl-CoA dehydrogenase
MGLNHKMGYRGTTNCLLAFGEGSRHRPDGEAGAVGFRVGEVGQGLAIMFQMMNEARIAVGVGAAALACRGYHHSLAYARKRAQGRPAAARGRNAEIPQVPIIMHPDVRRMLLTQKVFAEGALALVLYCARLVDEAANAVTDSARREAEALLGLLTPVLPKAGRPNSASLPTTSRYSYMAATATRATSMSSRSIAITCNFPVSN